MLLKKESIFLLVAFVDLFGTQDIAKDCHSDTKLAIWKRTRLHIAEPSLDHQMFGRPCAISVMGPTMKCSRED